MATLRDRSLSSLSPFRAIRFNLLLPDTFDDAPVPPSSSQPVVFNLSLFAGGDRNRAQNPLVQEVNPRVGKSMSLW